MSLRHLKLTAKEIAILQLMAHGYSDREIGEAVENTEHTVKSRVKIIYRKLGARNRANAVYLALGKGVLDE